MKPIYFSVFCAMTLLISACTKNPDPVIAAPVAGFGFSATSLIAPAAVVFTNTTVGQNVSYQWDFGDGGVSNDAAPSYTYANAGTYTVKLTAVNSGGSNSATKSITVQPLAGGLTRCSVERVTVLQYPNTYTSIDSVYYSVTDYLNNMMSTSGCLGANGFTIYPSDLPRGVYATQGGTPLNTTNISNNMNIKLNFYTTNRVQNSKIISFKPTDHAPVIGSPSTVFDINTTDGWGIRVQTLWQ